MLKIKKIILLVIIILLLCGCKNKKCVKSHEEAGRCVWYQYMRVGNVTMMIPHYYSCMKIICDDYED